MLPPYKQFLSVGRVFQHVRLHRVERIRCVRKPPRRKMPFDLPQKRVALVVACKFNRHAALVIRRSCRRRAKPAATQSPQPRQCRPSQLINHSFTKTASSQSALPLDSRTPSSSVLSRDPLPPRVGNQLSSSALNFHSRKLNVPSEFLEKQTRRETLAS